jgi:hypothetical protein
VTPREPRFPLEPVTRLVYITLIIGPFCMGCPEERGTPDAASDVAAVVDAGPPVAPADLPPADLGAELEVWLGDGGLISVPPARATLIDPAQKLTLRLPLLKDFRVRVFDGADKVVTSDDEAQVSDGGLDYAINLAEPLKRGREYRVLVDPETGPSIVDGIGRRYLESDWQLKVDGPAEPEPKEKPGKKSGAKAGKRRR